MQNIVFDLRTQQHGGVYAGKHCQIFAHWSIDLCLYACIQIYIVYLHIYTYKLETYVHLNTKNSVTFLSSFYTLTSNMYTSCFRVHKLHLYTCLEISWTVQEKGIGKKNGWCNLSKVSQTLQLITHNNSTECSLRH